MLLEGEEHSSVKNCKRLDSGLNRCLMMTGGPFSFFFFFLSFFFFFLQQHSHIYHTLQDRQCSRFQELCCSVL